VTAYGSVIPARRVVIEPQVSGYVIRQHPSLIPGGYVKQGDELFAIDPKLTELNLREARAEVARAEAALQEGTRKWQEGRRLASQEIIPDTELAALESARHILESDLERLRAAQDRELELLERHVIRAPFNSIVLEETVELGQRLAPGDVALTLVGTDEFWVRASVSTDKLRWVNVPSPERSGSSVDVYLDIGEGELARYHGQVIELLSDLEEVGRMARVLISVPDPLQLSHSANPHPLLLGSYVRVEIAAGELRNVLALDRSALREGNRLWIVDANNRLQIRNAKVLWRQEDRVFLEAALGPAETVVVSDLRVALPDTEVRAQPAVEASARDAAVQVIQP
jgi:RND family efflux transporter MFP subunit